MTRKKKRKSTRESGQMGSVDEFSAMMVNMVAKRCADCGEETDLFKQGLAGRSGVLSAIENESTTST